MLPSPRPDPAPGPTHAVWPEPAPGPGREARPTALSVDVGIIGAGIHGAALARELTLRHVSCALVDRGAVGGGTSQGSTKLFHGGIRYLATGDVRQMREGLAARAGWVRIAPHRCRWEAFWMPHRGLFERVSHQVGIGLYDHWGADRPGWPAQLKLGAVPGRDFEADPRARGGPFTGAVAYADCLTWDREVVQDLVASSEARVLDWHAVASWEDRAGRLTAATVRDQRDGTLRTVTASRWVFALGPWTDAALGQWFQEESHRLRLSAGVHLWLDPVPGCARPWAMRLPQGRILFAIPRDGCLQVGTTEREVDAGWAPVTAGEREELYAGLASAMPGIPWRGLKVHREETAVRPLLGARGQTQRLSREAVLEAHPRWANLRIVLGGKLTTARILMDQLATVLTGVPCPASAVQALVAWDGQPFGMR